MSRSLEDVKRSVYVGSPELNEPFGYPNNYVKTAKYTWYSFIPKNLLEQFMRIANVYFLAISLLQQIPNVSPTGKWTTMGPLIFVLSVTAIKEAFEDIRRHRQDEQLNSRTTQVVRGSSLTRVLWKNVQVGDIVYLQNKDNVPADMIVLSTSELQGQCYVETSSLDGETNLKLRQALPCTNHLSSVDSIQKELTGVKVKCEEPTHVLSQFEGTIELAGQEHALKPSQLLLRGAMLRNTKWIFGVVLYTGVDTKIMKNARKPPIKRSNVERAVNTQILLMFGFLFAVALTSTIGFGLWQRANATDWYLMMGKDKTVQAALAFITFVILYNNLIPISLYVTVEIVKTVQAYYINNDMDMYDPDSKTYAQARTSNLNEELGQVQYIFSDKTGTLTCNRMRFKKCSLGGNSYGSSGDDSTSLPAVGSTNSSENLIQPNLVVPPDQEAAQISQDSSHIQQSNGNDADVVWNDPNFLRDLHGETQRANVIREALTLLSVCHTVIPEIEEDNTIVYQASSPDESALVKAARHFGFEFCKRTPSTVVVNIEGKERVFELLQTLEFSGNRKRMSVIVRNDEGKLMLYTKGADSVILERLSPDNQPYLQETLQHMEEFAQDGLRILCLGVRELDEEEYNDWAKKFHIANTQIGGREKALEEVAELIEKNLFLLGATAVEDELQVGVPETIATLGTAGIKLWVLTGDKQATAINIGYSCRLLNSQMKLVVMNEHTEEGLSAKLDSLLSEYSSHTENEALGLIIDGVTLKFALLENYSLKFLELAQKFKSVICCRVSPGQKASIVLLVRKNLSAISLAIGDGANDVSMIQAAHVGVGISGQEGLQAVRASDFGIAQFRFLKKLLLVHGRWSYRRISKVILYSFYKNILLQFTQFWFTFFNGYSGQSLYERWTLAVFNVLFTFLPVMAFGITDVDLGVKMLYAHPQLYKLGQQKYYVGDCIGRLSNRKQFDSWTFWCWTMNAVYHSAIIFFGVYFCWREVVQVDGQTFGLWTMGTIMYTCIIIVVTGKLCLETRRWTYLFYFMVILTFFLWIAWMLVYGVFAMLRFISLGNDFLFVPHNFLKSPNYYFIIVLVSATALTRDFTWKYVKRNYLPQMYHHAQDEEKRTQESQGARILDE